MSLYAAAILIISLLVVVILRSTKVIKDKGVAAGVLSALAFASLIIWATSGEAREKIETKYINYEGNHIAVVAKPWNDPDNKRGFMNIWIDYPIDGSATECVKEGDQTSSNLAAGYYILQYKVVSVGGMIYHKSCAGNDDARGQSIDDQLAVVRFELTDRIFATGAYGTQKQPYYTLGLSLIEFDQFNLDFGYQRGLEDKVFLGLTWNFDFENIRFF